jgi:hypothetical protein
MCKSTETKLVFGNQNNDPTKQRKEDKTKTNTQPKVVQPKEEKILKISESDSEQNPKQN